MSRICFLLDTHGTATRFSFRSLLVLLIGSFLLLAGDASAQKPSEDKLLRSLPSPILLQGNSHTAYRDPLLFYEAGRFHLFYSYVREEEDHLIYWYVGVSESKDLQHWSQTRVITPKDQNLNFSSPGSIVHDGKDWVLCLQTYPIVDFRRGDKLRYTDARARLFVMKTRDLQHWSKPEILLVKGPNVTGSALGKMIDPFLMRDKDRPSTWICFYKQNGSIHLSTSLDMKTWQPSETQIATGENPSLLVDGNDYVLFYAPKNGIGIKRSPDLKVWREDQPPVTLGQAGWGWAETRLTAGFVVDLRKVHGIGQYVMVYHGMGPGNKFMDENTNANCSIGIAWSNDLKVWHWPGETGLPM